MNAALAIFHQTTGELDMAQVNVDSFVWITCIVLLVRGIHRILAAR